MIHTPKLMEKIVVQVPQKIAETYRKTTEKSLADFMVFVSMPQSWMMIWKGSLISSAYSIGMLV